MNICRRLLSIGVHCGCMWYGNIAQCEDCKRKDLEERILIKQEQLLDKQLRNES